MRKQLLGISASVSLAVAFAVIAPEISTSVHAAPDSNPVTICHFDGHQIDFVTGSAKTSGNPLCEFLGGQPMTVGQQACENGHQARPYFLNDHPHYTCADGAQQQ